MSEARTRPRPTRRLLPVLGVVSVLAAAAAPTALAQAPVPAPTLPLVESDVVEHVTQAVTSAGPAAAPVVTPPAAGGPVDDPPAAVPPAVSEHLPTIASPGDASNGIDAGVQALERVLAPVRSGAPPAAVPAPPAARTRDEPPAPRSTPADVRAAAPHESVAELSAPALETLVTAPAPRLKGTSAPVVPALGGTPAQRKLGPAAVAVGETGTVVTSRGYGALVRADGPSDQAVATHDRQESPRPTREPLREPPSLPVSGLVSSATAGAGAVSTFLAALAAVLFLAAPGVGRLLRSRLPSPPQPVLNFSLERPG